MKRTHTIRLAAIAAVLVCRTAVAGPAVTLYSHDLGFVRETRDLTLRAARDTVRIEGVSTALDFTSVRLAPANGRVLRLSYRWDTATGDGLLEHSVGERVRVNSRGDRVDEGVLLAADGAWLVLRGDDGALTNVSRATVEQVRLAKPSGALSMRPAIEAVIDGARGNTKAELSYLTGGLSWSAEHTLVRTGETSAIWSAAVQMQNTTGRSFEDATVKLIAGDPSRTSVSIDPRPIMMMKSAMADAAPAPGGMSEQAFADYHLYTLDGPVTLRDRETQSVTMIRPRAITVKPRYYYRSGDARGVLSQLEVLNAEKSGPGVPLPGGRVRTFTQDGAGDLQFIGESNIAHTAVDEKCTVDLGYAFDLAATRRNVSEKRVSDRERTYVVEIELRNRKTTAATIVVEEPLGGDSEIIQSSLPAVRKDANTVQFTVELAAGKTVTLSYSARQRW